MSAVPLIPEPYTHTRRYNSLSPDDIYSEELIIAVKESTEERGRLGIWEEIRKSAPEKVVLLGVATFKCSYFSNLG